MSTNYQFLTRWALAREALGEGARPGLAEWLGRIAPDCPLIIVVAAALISRGSVDPARLHGSDRIRVEIMQAFRDAMTAGWTPVTRMCAGRS